MKRAARLGILNAAVAISCALYGCGGTTTSVDFAAAGNDLATPADLSTPPPDLTTIPPDLLMSTPDMTKPAADMAGPAMCASKADCKGDPCCLTVKNSAFLGLACTNAPADCAPSLDLTGSGQTRLCTTNADCTSGLQASSLPTCCTGMQNGSSIHLCFSMLYASLSGGAVTCP